MNNNNINSIFLNVLHEVVKTLDPEIKNLIELQVKDRDIYNDLLNLINLRISVSIDKKIDEIIQDKVEELIMPGLSKSIEFNVAERSNLINNEVIKLVEKFISEIQYRY